MKKFVPMLLAGLLFSAAAFANPLDDARQKGYVVEMPSGYIQATSKAPADVNKLVADINAKRKAVYEQIAKKHGISAKQVGEESYRKRVKGE